MATGGPRAGPGPLGPLGRAPGARGEVIRAGGGRGWAGAVILGRGGGPPRAPRLAARHWGPAQGAQELGPGPWPPCGHVFLQ